MIIAMAHFMSGGRYDDREWPGVGVPFEVPDWEGEGAVRSHSAVDVSDRYTREDLPPRLRLPGSDVPAPPPPQSAIDAYQEASNEIRYLTEAADLAEPAQDPEPRWQVPADGPAEPPKPADPKQAWMDYAVTQGLTEDQAGEMTKADLMSRFGGRL